jgi:predicted small secreted protein
MKTIVLLKFALITILGMTLMLAAGCRTAEGFGRDVEAAGEGIQREAR